MTPAKPRRVKRNGLYYRGAYYALFPAFDGDIQPEIATLCGKASGRVAVCENGEWRLYELKAVGQVKGE